jgi:hypothetical protein
VSCVGFLRVDALRANSLGDLGKTDFDKADLDNTDAVRDHSFHCIANAESRRPPAILPMWG